MILIRKTQWRKPENEPSLYMVRDEVEIQENKHQAGNWVPHKHEMNENNKIGQLS